MLRKFIPLALLAVAPVVGMAQGQRVYLLEYNIGLSTGDLHEYIDDPSFRGFTFGFRQFTDNTVCVGVDLGWQTFFEKKDYATYTDGTQSISGTQFRYTNLFTASLQADYVFNDGGDIRPFIGVGAGTSYARRTLDMGQWRLTKDPWQFLIQPEAGVSLYMSNGHALILSGNYYWGIETKELPAQSYFAVGLAYGISE